MTEPRIETPLIVCPCGFRVSETLRQDLAVEAHFDHDCSLVERQPTFTELAFTWRGVILLSVAAVAGAATYITALLT